MDVAWSPIARSYDPLKAGSIDGTDVKPHDHGIVRAMEATYKTSKHVKTDPRVTVFVARLSPATNEDTIREVSIKDMEFFSQYGDIKNCHLVRDVVTGFSKRYAFIEFYDTKDALAACGANQLAIDDCKIFVDFEQERVLPGWIPRRLGGGFGGKKESGQLRFGGLDRPFRKPIVLGSSKTGPSDFRSWEPGAPVPSKNNQLPRRHEGHCSDYRARDHDRKDEFLRQKRLSYERSRERHKVDHRNDRPERPYGRPHESSSDRWRQYEDREQRFERHGREHRPHRSPVH